MWTREHYKANCEKARRYFKIWRKRRWWFNEREPISRFTGWLAAYTAVLMVVGLLQWCTLEKTNQTMRLQERAWIAPGKLIAPKNFVDQKEQDAAIELTFQNIGKEPAIETNEQIRTDIIETNKWGDEAFLRAKVREMLDNRSCKNFDPSSDGRAIFPGTNPARYIDLEEDKAIKASRDQTHFALVVACFVYRTVSEIHRSRFCGVLAPPNRSNDFMWQSVLCGVENGAD